MADTVDVRFKFTFNDERVLEIQTKLTENDRRNAGSSIEATMRSGYVAIELDGKLQIIPTHNLQTLEISPSPHVLLANCISGAKRV